MVLMAPKRSTLFFIIIVVILASLLSDSLAGSHRKLADVSSSQVEATVKDEWKNKDTDDEELVFLGRSRILTVKTNDYGNYEPTPSLSKPPFKLIPN